MICINVIYSIKVKKFMKYNNTLISKSNNNNKIIKYLYLIKMKLKNNILQIMIQNIFSIMNSFSIYSMKTLFIMFMVLLNQIQKKLKKLCKYKDNLVMMKLPIYLYLISSLASANANLLKCYVLICFYNLPHNAFINYVSD